MEDRLILQRMRDDPSEGLRDALKKYGGLVRLVVSRLLENRQDVEECVADAFINVWKNIDKIQGGSLKGYLLCAARNLSINRLKQSKRHMPVLLDEDEPAPDDVGLLVSWQEQAAILQHLITQMTEPDREILIRRYYLFERIKDIAQQLGFDETQVKSRLYRCRQRLKKSLEERGIHYAAV